MKNKPIVLILCLWGVFLSAGCAPAEPPPFSGEQALSLVQSQVDFGPRVPGSEAHRACADWLAGELRQQTDDVRRQGFSYVSPAPDPVPADWQPDTLKLWNIIASFFPQSPHRILICAHWDSRPWADEEPDSSLHTEPVMGANDGASGVAVCLELARMMKQQPPPFGVDIALFDAEDMGTSESLGEYIIGSRLFVRNAPNYRPLAVILLDMIGDADLNIPRERFSDSLAPALVDLVWGTAARLRLDAFVDTVGVTVVDDHLPFLLAGIPAVDLIDFEYEYWHTIHDTPDKVSAQSLETVGRLVTELIYATPVTRFQSLGRAAPAGP